MTDKDSQHAGSLVPLSRGPILPYKEDVGGSSPSAPTSTDHPRRCRSDNFGGDPEWSEYAHSMRLTAAITREGDWYVARCLEVEVASQGESLDEARVNLVEALELYFEDDAGLEIAESPIIVPVDVAV